VDKKRRGLGALIPNVAWRGREEPATELSLDLILPNPFQPRQPAAGEHLEELVASIRLHGIIQPLVVRPREGGYQLVAGQRRLAAARKAGLASVPVVIRHCSDRELLELALVENLQREDLNPMDAAAAYQRLVAEFGLSQEEVADRVGKSRPTVANTIRLLQLPGPVQQSLRQGRISEGHGRALLGAGNPDRMVQLCRLVEQRALSVRQAEALARLPAAPPPPSPRRQLDPNLAHLEDRLRQALGTKVTLRPRGDGRRGTIEVEYYSAEDLERILDLVAGKEGPR